MVTAFVVLLKYTYAVLCKFFRLENATMDGFETYTTENCNHETLPQQFGERNLIKKIELV